MLYMQKYDDRGRPIHLSAYDINNEQVFIGQVKLTDILDELDKYREEGKV
jgi:hypothetical protein